MERIVIRTDGLDGFKKRAREHAAALDSGETLPAESGITLSSPEDLFQLLTPRRLALLKALSTSGSRPVVDLAKELNRSSAAVSRDLVVLDRLGAVERSHVTRAGGASTPVVSPVAIRLDVVCTIDLAKPGPRKLMSNR